MLHHLTHARYLSVIVLTNVVMHLDRMNTKCTPVYLHRDNRDQDDKTRKDEEIIVEPYRARPLLSWSHRSTHVNIIYQARRIDSFRKQKSATW
jgi:hypothetical protein